MNKKAILKNEDIKLEHLHAHLINIGEQLSIILKQNKKIMATQKEAADKLAAIGTQLAKVNTEIQAKIQELQDAAGNADNVSPELQTAIDGLVASAQTLDDIVPDATGGTDGGNA